MNGAQAVVVWIVELSLLGAGLWFGYYLGKLNRKTMATGAEWIQEDIDRQYGELEAYRREVNQNFHDFKGTLRHLGEEYCHLLNHLADGGERLCCDNMDILESMRERGRLATGRIDDTDHPDGEKRSPDQHSARKEHDKNA